MPQENYKDDSRVANQNSAVSIINQSESDFKRYFGDDPLQDLLVIQLYVCAYYGHGCSTSDDQATFKRIGDNLQPF